MGSGTRSAQDLLLAARALLERPPEQGESLDDRAAGVRAIARQLDTHGVDGLSLIRFGMGQLFAGPVLGSVAASVFLSMHGEQLDEDAQPINVAGWRSALGVEEGLAKPDDLSALLGHAASMIGAWIVSAPFDSLVRLEPVPKEALAAWATAVDESTRAAAEVYVWLVDRSIEADVEKWSTSSLKLEYRYSVLGEALEAPEAFLAISSTEPNGLAHALAARVIREETDHHQAEWAALLSAVQKQAKGLLRQGRCAEAAALFDFLVGRNPGDPALRNNLAFCLVTSNPADATEHLRDAQRMGFEPKSLLLYNRACCATTEALKREVLFDANRHWVADLEPVPVGAFIWRRIGGEYFPGDVFDVRIDLARAAAGLAFELGELDRAQVWGTRLLELQPVTDAASTGDPDEVH